MKRMKLICSGLDVGNNEDDDDDKDNNMGLMTVSKSKARVLLYRMGEWPGWCLTLETRFP